MTKEEARLLLKLDDDYNDENLKKAYKREIKNVHPDVNHNLENATELTQKINEAYELLKQCLKSKKSTSFDAERKYKEETIDFQEYKQSILAKINYMFDIIKVEKNYKNDFLFEYYKKYILKEIEYYKEFYDNIKNKSINERDILLFESLHQYKIDNLFNKFTHQLFNKFIKKSASFTDLEWLIEKCEVYINKNDFKPKTINECMQYYINVKKSIVKRVIDKKITFYISKLSWSNKKYLKDNTKIEIINNLFLKLSPEDILENENVIRKEFKNYINKRKIEYIKFLFEKNYKIINLNFLAFKNDIDLDKKQLKKLKLERREDKFNEKYLIIEKDFMEILNFKTHNKHR